MMDLSIVIPAFNEACKIARDVEEAALFFEREGVSGEVIVVDDGSTDGTAAAARAAKVPCSTRLETIRLERNMGKGFALKAGVLQTSGGVVIYADSGTCVPYGDALPLIRRVRAGELDLAMASRRLKQSVIRRDRPLKRRILGQAFHMAAIAIGGLPRRITDSQCGFKVYAGEVARGLYAGLETRGFLFELEIVLKALRRGYRLEEFPVTWTFDPDTRLRPASQARAIIKELFAVRRIIRNEPERGAGRMKTDDG
jgi:dolichyl-phosphate beta-glucosyltransferase